MELLIFLRDREVSKLPGIEYSVFCILHLFRLEQLKWPTLVPDDGNALGDMARSGRPFDSRHVIVGSEDQPCPVQLISPGLVFGVIFP